MRFNRTLTSVALATLLLVASTMGAAAIAWDTETTTTSTQSDLSGTSTTIDFYPGNSSESIYVEVDGAASENLTLSLSPAADGINSTLYENATPTTVNASAGHYAWNISHAELDELPRDVNGGTYNVTVVNESGGDELNTQLTLNTAVTSPKAVMYVASTGTDNARAATNFYADRLSVSSEEGWLEWGNATTVATWSGFTTVNGTETVTEVHLKNSSTADAYDAAASDVKDGEHIASATLFANGLPMPIYKTSSPDDVNGTHAVYNSDSNVLSVHTAGEEYEATNTLQLRGAAGQSYGFWEMKNIYGWGAAFGVLW